MGHIDRHTIAKIWKILRAVLKSRPKNMNKGLIYKNNLQSRWVQKRKKIIFSGFKMICKKLLGYLGALILSLS